MFQLVLLYEKLNGYDIKPSIEKFAKILARIGVWNTDIEKHFEALEWKVEDNGFVYLSNSGFGFLKTHFSSPPYLKGGAETMKIDTNEVQGNQLLITFRKEGLENKPFMNFEIT